MHGGQLASPARAQATIGSGIEGARGAIDRFGKIRATLVEMADCIDGQRNSIERPAGPNPPSAVPNGQAEELEATASQLHQHAEAIERLLERIGSRL